MKTLKTKLMLVALFLSSATFMSCQKSNDNASQKSPLLDTSAWRSSETTSRHDSVRGEIPTKTILKCRTNQSTDVIYYYTLIANPEAKNVFKSDFKYITSEFEDAEINVQVFKTNLNNTDLILERQISVPVTAISVLKENGDKNLYLYSKKETVSLLKTYYDKIFDLTTIKEDELLFDFINYNEAKQNTLETSYPSFGAGVINSTTLECI